MPPKPEPAGEPARALSHDVEAERVLLRALEQVRAGKAFVLRSVQPKLPRAPSSS